MLHSPGWPTAFEHKTFLAFQQAALIGTVVAAQLAVTPDPSP
jgi:hypothetical protein